ncbi:TRAP transporter small permease [Shumkonia mesophila]|uniref:TRAP transporter small permease n=1 Tax=Shumkonia mesophila TaxID=2838854 RepID=UPI0029349D4E|nr:TRAP transporter small permease [Shumkonia mesophila]
MRKILDHLYRGSGVVAAVFLAAICVVVLLQVGANVIDALASWLLGHSFGLVVPSYAEFAGFFLAGTSFLALAYTLRCGAHIRVSMIIQTLSTAQRRFVEIWCAGLGAVLSAYFAVYTVGLVVESIEFGDVSPGMVALPLWIPQVPMAIGLIVLTVALVDEFFEALAGREPSYVHGRFAGGDAGAGDDVSVPME